MREILCANDSVERDRNAHLRPIYVVDGRVTVAPRLAKEVGFGGLACLFDVETKEPCSVPAQDLAFDVGVQWRIAVVLPDVFRDRERGVPRYNNFRRMLRMRPVQSFE